MKPITGIKDAEALPERDSYKVVDEVLPDGTTLRSIRFHGLVAVEKDDDAIVMFEDKDGRMMSVGYDSQGAFKTPTSDLLATVTSLVPELDADGQIVQG